MPLDVSALESALSELVPQYYAFGREAREDAVQVAKALVEALHDISCLAHMYRPPPRRSRFLVVLRPHGLGQYHAPSWTRDRADVNAPGTHYPWAIDAGTAERSAAAGVVFSRCAQSREADQRYDLANRQDGGLMIDLVDPDGVTAEWLTKVFVAEGVLGSGSVVSCAAEPLAAMSFTGVFRRLELSYDIDEPGLPRTLIAKFSTPDLGIRAAVHSMGFYAREVAFYRELAATTPVPVPVCYHAAVDENDGRCVILLQDLTTARRGRSTDACSPAEVERAIHAIVPLHARWWQNTDVEFRQWLDPDAIMPLDATPPQFEALWPVFLEKLSIPITDQVRQFGEWAAIQLRPVIQRLFHETPLTVIHHDFQADNLLFGRASDSIPLVVIDWQMLVRGRGPVDLAYLLSGSMDPEDRRRHELNLVTRYAGQLEAAGVRDYDAAQCLEDYRAALLLPPVRLALAVGDIPHMTAHRGAFWDVLFQRQIRALVDNGAFGS